MNECAGQALWTLESFKMAFLNTHSTAAMCTSMKEIHCFMSSSVRAACVARVIMNYYALTINI